MPGRDGSVRARRGDASDRPAPARQRTAATFALPQRASPSRLRSTRCAATCAGSATATASQVQFKDRRVRQRRCAGTAAGTWHRTPAVPATIDLEGAADAREPRQRASLPAASTLDAARARLAAPRARQGHVERREARRSPAISRSFRSRQGKGGQFLFVAKAQDATLDYARELAADHRHRRRRALRRPRLVDRRAAAACSARASARRAPRSPICTTRSRCCRSTATPSGPTSEFLAFVAQTPIADWIGHVDRRRDGRPATARSRSSSTCRCSELERRRASTASTVSRRTASARRALPPLTAVNGTLAFTEHELHARRRHRGSARRSAQAPDRQRATGRVRVTGDGQRRSAASSAQRIRRCRCSIDVSGTTDWQAGRRCARRHASHGRSSRRCKGATIDLPAPLRQDAPTRRSRCASSAASRARNDDRIVVDYGARRALLLHRQHRADSATVDRALVLLGKAVDRRPPTPSSRACGCAPTCRRSNVDEWLAVDARSRRRPRRAARGGAAASRSNGVDLTAATLQALGPQVHAICRSIARRQRRRLAADARRRARSPARPSGAARRRRSRTAASSRASRG